MVLEWPEIVQVVDWLSEGTGEGVVFEGTWVWDVVEVRH